MFPVPSSQLLTISKVADYWSREMKPPARRDELFGLLVKAWWRGDLAASGAQRLDVLKAIHKHPPSWITFEDDQQIKELPDGIVEVRQFVPLPKSNPNSWTDDDCTEAFRVIAEIWDSSDFELLAPVVYGLELTEAEFTRWVGSSGYKKGTFWARGGGGQDTPTADKISRARLTELAREYCESVKEGGQPSQIGFENWLETKNIHGPRGDVRSAYQEIAGPLQRGRPTKKEPSRRDETENFPELNSPRIANNAPPDRNDP